MKVYSLKVNKNKMKIFNFNFFKFILIFTFKAGIFKRILNIKTKNSAHLIS